jgi:ABC-type branched-subunit amino acid transport system substrate-binding protein
MRSGGPMLALDLRGDRGGALFSPRATLRPVPTENPRIFDFDLTTGIDRRGFVRSAAWMGAALLVPGSVRGRETGELRIGAAIPAGGGAGVASAGRGVELGVEEASRTGELMGRRVTLVKVDSTPSIGVLRAAGVAAVVGGFGIEDCRALGAAAAGAGVLMLNVGCGADALRVSACASGTFHVAPSDAMKRAAHGGGGGAGAVAWSPKLEKYGAAQLNDRFRARFNLPMDGPAWVAWVAVKMLAETSLRARSTEPRALAARLVAEDTRFDGHKGWPLSFRAGNHQLRQPLYLVNSAGEVVGEVPERGPENGQSPRALLDRLVGPEPTGACTSPSSAPR